MADMKSAAAAELWALLHNGRPAEGHWTAESQRYYEQVVVSFAASPALLALAQERERSDG